MVVTPRPREQTRARYPDEAGYVERDGVRVSYEVYGDGPTTFLLFPTSPISHSRLWKAQIPYLSRHVRVITFDPRGNGRSDRPDTAEAYSYWEFAEDGRAILKATRTETAILAGIRDGGGWALMLAATQPAMALGVAAIAPCVPRLTPSHPNYRRYPSLEPLDTDEGWARWNVHYWRRTIAASSSSSSPSSLRSRTRRSTSKTVSSGPRRKRRGARFLGRGGAATVCERAGGPRAVPPRSLPGARRPRRARRMPAARARHRRRRAGRRDARHARGRRASPAGAPSREGQSAPARVCGLGCAAGVDPLVRVAEGSESRAPIIPLVITRSDGDPSGSDQAVTRQDGFATPQGVSLYQLRVTA
jgi:pimeloyl-ACP methyl ester carboxylesterase